MALKNVIFDMGGVLINLDKQACLNAFKELGVSDLYKYVDSYTQSGFLSEFEEGNITEYEFYNKIRDLADEKESEISNEQIKNAWMKFLLEIPQEKLDMIDELRKKYKVYLLSNTNPIHFPIINERYNLRSHFDDVYLSCEIHHSKPDQRVFKYLLKDAGIEARESLFIDDGIANIAAARTLGFQTYHAAENDDLLSIYNEIK